MTSITAPSTSKYTAVGGLVALDLACATCEGLWRLDMWAYLHLLVEGGAREAFMLHERYPAGKPMVIRLLETCVAANRV